jgi:hypothetical protein
MICLKSLRRGVLLQIHIGVIALNLPLATHFDMMLGTRQFVDAAS